MFLLNRCGEEVMRVEETRRDRRGRSYRFRLIRVFIILLFTILYIRTYELQITNGERARLKSETYKDVVIKKSIFNETTTRQKKTHH